MASNKSHYIHKGREDPSETLEDLYFSKVQNRNLYLATFAALLGALSFGFVMGYSSPAIPDLKGKDPRHLRMGEVDSEWFGSIMAVGAAIGTLFGVWLINTLGRKLTLVLSSLPFIFGYTLIVASPNIWILCGGRLLTGLSTGVTSLVVPIYVTEIAHNRVRGILNSCFQLMVATGIVGAYIAGVAFAWRWLAVTGCIPPFLMLLLMAVMPETPRFLLSKGRRSEALTSLLFLRGPDADLEWECKEIEQNIKIRGDRFRSDDFLNSVYKPLIIGTFLMIFQQLTGINAIIFYAQSTFDQANFTNSSLAAVTVGVIHLFFTVVAIVMVDKAGRKVLLIFSGVLMAASLGFLGAYFKLAPGAVNKPSPTDTPTEEDTPTSGRFENMDWLAVSSLGIFVAGYAIGWGPIPWLLMSEIIPFRVKGSITGFCIMISWGFAFLVTIECFDLMDALTDFGTFLLFAGFCVLGIIYTIFFVPETKGKTMEEMEVYFQRKAAVKNSL